MFRQIVKDYALIDPIASSQLLPAGDSASPKELIFHILKDNAADVEVLDIGFGRGALGELIKGTPQTAHWSVDGVDGFEGACNHPALFERKIYRNIWHGLAQGVPSDRFARYDIICLLDVIEHLTADTARWLLRTLLTSMGDNSFLFISTPLWFYPQHSQQSGDLEEHLIGVPATSMMALLPVMYAMNPPLIGGFVLTKRSLDFIEFFQPTADRSFSYQRGMLIANAVNFQCVPGKFFKLL
ncbi:methyltransferase domain-containing protein [Dyella jejuensis]|uniref:Methyltransferase domain-containing protein n=1 Tax=Dyella jejuensis TaxID=1432009 RepID=A0ABW8JFD0_9GAMM